MKGMMLLPRRLSWLTIEVIAVTTVAFVGLGLFVWREAAHVRGSKPTSADQTPAGYLDHRGTPPHAREVVVAGKAFTFCIGGIPNGSVPSGPVVYVFDADGKLVDSTWDSGDDSGFQGRGPSKSWSGPDLSPQELIARAAAGRK